MVSGALSEGLWRRCGDEARTRRSSDDELTLLASSACSRLGLGHSTLSLSGSHRRE